MASLRPNFRACAPADRAALRANAVVLWVAIIVVVAAQAVILRWSHLTVISSPKLSFNICVCFILAVIGFFCTFRDFRPRLALIASSLAQLVTASIALCLLTYSLTALAGSTPLRDATLAAIDGSLGFHWPDLLRWSEAHPRLSDLAGHVYGSIPEQAVAVVVVLGLRADFRKLQSAVFAYMIALTLTAVVSYLVPAVGAYAFFDIHGTMHPNVVLRTAQLPVPDIRGLRDHVMTSFELENVKGVISFPSFHAALGVLFIWCSWSVPGLRWVGAAINAVLIAATPLHGSHYLIDVVMGLLIGIAAIRCAVSLHAAVGSRGAAIRDGRTGLVRRRPTSLATSSGAVIPLSVAAVGQRTACVPLILRPAEAMPGARRAAGE